MSLALCLACQPSAKQLVADFSDKRAKYEELLAMIAQDPHGAVSPERQAKYRDYLEELGLQQLSRGTRPGEIFLSFKPRGLGSRGCAPGLTHVPEPPSPLVESIDRADPNATTVYQHIDDGWYLFCHRS
ncbi:MAG TPA: hypothetical protein VMR86_19595 [Myxococcota bacterium]|nr:hypothetical protein [Myxococcota bacterium]